VHPQQDLVRPNIDDVAELAGQPDGVRVAAVVEGDAELEPVNRLGLGRLGGEGDGDAASSIQYLWPPPLLLSTCRPRRPRCPRVGGGDELWAPPPRLHSRLPRCLPPWPRPSGLPSRPPLDPMPSAMPWLAPPCSGVEKNGGEEGKSQCRCARLAGRGYFKTT
jgi:hypothetical protein